MFRHVKDVYCTVSFYGVGLFRWILQHFTVCWLILDWQESLAKQTLLERGQCWQVLQPLRSEFVGPQCDVYAFGGVTMITLTEKVVWPGLNPFQIMQNITVKGKNQTQTGCCPIARLWRCVISALARSKDHGSSKTLFVCHCKRLISYCWYQ